VKSGGEPAKLSLKLKLRFSRAGGAVFFGLLVVLCFCAAGCERERTAKLSQSQIHQVTQELAKAASEAAPNGSLIKIRRARGGASGGADEIYIGLHGSAVTVDKLEQRLDAVATQHRLTVDAASVSGTTARITLRSGGVPTHRIEIETLSSHPMESTANPVAGQARLAILLDDLGSDRSAADAIFALHVPITISILPYHEHSQEIAREGHKLGCEVMLHLPMQSLANETPEQQELRPGLSKNDVDDMVSEMLRSLPEADGVNNHQGSQATSNSVLMDELMPVLRDAGVFYVDSRTTAATVAYDTAKRDGVKTAFRNVPFLDDVQTTAAVKRQLQIAIRGAKQKGEAIAIGHPHAATLEALREMLPEMKKQGVRLVLVSEVVH
jgi:polysaccharide deacetylase 2 family uncharacterized protein YibQ